MCGALQCVRCTFLDGPRFPLCPDAHVPRPDGRPGRSPGPSVKGSKDGPDTQTGNGSFVLWKRVTAAKIAHWRAAVTKVEISKRGVHPYRQGSPATGRRAASARFRRESAPQCNTAYPPQGSRRTRARTLRDSPPVSRVAPSPAPRRVCRVAPARLCPETSVV